MSKRGRWCKFQAEGLQVQEGPIVQFKSEGREKPTSQLEGSQAERILFSSGEVKLCFVLSGPSLDRMRPTHVGENSLLYSGY